MQKIRINGFFFKQATLAVPSGGEKNSTNCYLRTHIYSRTNKILFVRWLSISTAEEDFGNSLSNLGTPSVVTTSIYSMYTRVNKNPSAWNFLSSKPEVMCGTVAIIIRVVLFSPYLRIRAVSLSSNHYNQSHRVYINRRRQYICLIWN